MAIMIKLKLTRSERGIVKLQDLSIDHIAGVTYPANRRKFLIIKNEKEPEPTAEPIGKTDTEIFSDYVLAVSKVRGMTLEQLFREKPELYSWYQQMVNAPKYY